MLITFSTKVSADITLFGEVAKELLKLMGQTGGVPGALLAADIPPALERLKAAVAAVGARPSGNPPRSADEENDDERAPPLVSLRQRAVPLIGLLEAAVAGKADVMWTATGGSSS
jgi:hypothetical protein